MIYGIMNPRLCSESVVGCKMRTKTRRNLRTLATTENYCVDRNFCVHHADRSYNVFGFFSLVRILLIIRTIWSSQSRCSCGAVMAD